jgi:chromosomal replication initiation ATPase DnaA
MPLKILRQQYINELTAQEIGDLRDLLKRLKKIEPVQKKVLPKPKNKTYRKISLDEVIKSFQVLAAIVCMKHRISYDELTNHCRKRHLVDARTDFTHIAYDKICYNKALISRFLGRRDHATIINLLFKNPTKIHGEIKELFGAK